MQANSIELKVADWIALGDALQHQAAALQQESRETLDAVLEQLQALAAQSDRDCAAIEKAMRDLERDWAEIDDVVMEMIARATDEIATFVTAQEVRVRKLERQVRRDRNHKRLHDVSSRTDDEQMSSAKDSSENRSNQ